MTLNRERDMKQTDQGIDWSTVVSRALLFSLLWWALTDGTAGSWWIGAPAVAGAVIISVTLVPPLGLVWREAMGFVPFFLWHSLKGGVDVAWRAFHPRLPITPELIEYPLRLPPGLPRIILVNTVSLLPGTLSAELGGQVLKVHVLDSLGDFLAELEALEQRVGCMFRSASDDFPRR
jgi:multicomponent Na+:H+ antiporter subunit E